MEAVRDIYKSRKQLLDDEVDPYDIEVLNDVLAEIDRKRKLK